MNTQKMMGFEASGDQRVPVMVRDWNGMKLALWRSKVAWDIAAREAAEILGRCVHAPDCLGEDLETELCLPHCPDRELRMSALVIMNAARMFAPIDARRVANEPYMAPSREYFSEVIAELATTQLERDVLREALRAAGVEPPSPPENPEKPRLPARATTRLREDFVLPENTDLPEGTELPDGTTLPDGTELQPEETSP